MLTLHLMFFSHRHSRFASDAAAGEISVDSVGLHHGHCLAVRNIIMTQWRLAGGIAVANKCRQYFKSSWPPL